MVRRHAFGVDPDGALGKMRRSLGVAGIEQQHRVGRQRARMVGPLRQGPFEALGGPLPVSGAAQRDRLADHAIGVVGPGHLGLWLIAHDVVAGSG